MFRSEVDQRGFENGRLQHFRRTTSRTPKQVQSALQFLFPVVQDPKDAVEFVDCGFELGPVCR